MFRHTTIHETRRGAVAVLAAILAIVLIGMVAFSVDIGYVLTAKEEMQRSADAAALAACSEFANQLSLGQDAASAAQLARLAAAEYAALNEVTRSGMMLDLNPSNDPAGDVVFGYVADFASSPVTFVMTSPDQYNAVRVRLTKDSATNGEVPYFFARVFGMRGQVLRASATAAVVRDVGGFKTPSDESNLGILPFALDLETWYELVSHTGSDQWRWNSDLQEFEAGHDGLIEVNLYPQGTGSPGNRGTVDIGSSSNSTHDLARQILDGVSPADLAHHGGKLEFNEDGKLYLNGNPGISAGIKDELASILGHPRVIPVFSQVTESGNNAQYTIVKWQGIRIVDVQLTGPMTKKHVTIQVAPIMVTKGVIPSSTSGTSSYVYSQAVLVE